MDTKFCKTCGSEMKFDNWADTSDFSENVAIFECTNEKCGNWAYHYVANSAKKEKIIVKPFRGIEIKFTFRGNCYSISIGHKTPWFEQMPFISVSQEYYDNPDKPREVSYARIIWMSSYDEGLL